MAIVAVDGGVYILNSENEWVRSNGDDTGIAIATPCFEGSKICAVDDETKMIYFYPVAVGI